MALNKKDPYELVKSGAVFRYTRSTNDAQFLIVDSVRNDNAYYFVCHLNEIVYTYVLLDTIGEEIFDGKLVFINNKGEELVELFKTFGYPVIGGHNRY